jgi:hypothetical protein
VDIFEGIINCIIIKTKTYGNIKTSIITHSFSPPIGDAPYEAQRLKKPP